MKNKHFDEHVAATKAAEQAARDAIMFWAQQHAPDAKVRDLARLIEKVENVIGSGMTRSNSAGFAQGKEAAATLASQ